MSDVNHLNFLFCERFYRILDNIFSTAELSAKMVILLLEQNILNSTNTTYNSRVLVFLKIYFCFSLVWPLESRFGLSRHIKKVNL